MNRAPGGYEAGIALKAGTAAALITDHERKAVATRVPYLDVFDQCNNATELHDTPQKAPQPPLKCACECYVTGSRFAICIRKPILGPCVRLLIFASRSPPRRSHRVPSGATKSNTTAIASAWSTTATACARSRTTAMTGPAAILGFGA